MRTSPPWRLALLALGGAVVGATVWVYVAGGPATLSMLGEADALTAAVMVALTAACVAVRFVRWQFLLRRLDVRIPIRPSLAIYLASLAGIATPAYAGEAMRAVFLKRRFAVPVRVGLTALVYERLLDFAALGLIAAVVVEGPWTRLLMAVVVGLAFGLGLLLGAVARGMGVPAKSLLQLRRAGSLGPALAMSLVAWLPATLLVGLATGALGEAVPTLAGVRIYSTSTVVGGLSLMPAGAGFAGGSAIVQLQELGLSTAMGVSAVSLMRLLSVGITFVVGAVFLALQLRRTRESAQTTTDHFDQISAEYADQFTDHVWNHLIERKIGMIERALGSAPSGTGLGLDLGCGLGLQYFEMQRRGHDVLGVDTSTGLLHEARRRGGRVVAGSGLQLPFADASFDYVYCVGVLHHLPGPDAQTLAIAEVLRVLRPGGRLLVHETNPRNPLFRFYMGYVFPAVKTIDEGTEHWIHPERWERADGLLLEHVEYFTFLPDFLPRFAMRPALGLERWLERSVLSVYSVHYFAALAKRGP